MTEVSSGSAAWLTIADNSQTWARLSGSLALAEGFELLFAVVVDQQAAGWLGELLEGRARELGRRFVSLDARDDDVLERLVGLADGGDALVVLDTVAASRRASAALDRCLLELNPRRDLLVERIPGPLIMVVRPDGLRRVADLAPDLFSVHTASFRLFGGVDLALDEQPEWLLSDHEFVGLLGIDPSFGFADRSRVPKIVREPPRPPERLFGREALLAELKARLVPGGERVIQISGQPGVGRTALLAQAVEFVQDRWDQVIWLDCRHLWGFWHECDDIVDAAIQVLAPDEVPPFDAEDARERFVELTTLHSTLIIADDLFWQADAVPGHRSCLVAVLDGRRGSTDLPPLDSAALHEFGHAEGLPNVEISAAFRERPRGPGCWQMLPGNIRVLSRWLRAQQDPTNAALARLRAKREKGSKRSGDLNDLCKAIVENSGPEQSAAFHALIELSGWVPEFSRSGVVDETALDNLVRLGILVNDGDHYRFSETGIGRWRYLDEPPRDWRKHLAIRPVADRLYATLGGALWEHDVQSEIPWLSNLAITSDDIEHCTASVPPPVRAAVWQAATDVVNTRGAYGSVFLEKAIVAALQCGQNEHARTIREHLDTNEVIGPLLHMLVMLRPAEWDPDTEQGRKLAEHYASTHAAPAIAAALRRGLDPQLRFTKNSVRYAPPARIALTLRSESRSAELLRELLATLDQSRELDRLAAHFVWARVAWLDILTNDWPSFERSFAETERSARVWGYPYALVRVRLLELTALEARGDLDWAAAKLPAALAAVDRNYGTRSRTALALLRRAVRIYTELDRSDDAEQAQAQIRARRRST